MDAATIACLKLIRDVDCNKYLDHPYCKPFIRYVMEWPHSLPIKTIIIGQNPYGGDIFPEYGSAFAYDPSKVSDKRYNPPPSISVLAEDLFNHNGTVKLDTINCFKESWRLLEHGVIMINESVFHRISKDLDRPNTGLLKEMESQIIALQTILSVGFEMGQTSVTLIGMGIGASMMTSVIRPWCPSDLISAKTMTCSNPAAFAKSLGDSSSQQITLGKSNISEVLSGIVDLYTKMPPKTSSADKRRQQNIDVLNKAKEEVIQSSHIENNELRSFKDRLAKLDPSNPSKNSVDDLQSSIDSLTKANDRHANAISVHSTSMLVLMDILSKEYPKSSDKQQSGPVPSTSESSAPVTPSAGARRRVPRRTPTSTSQTDVVPSIPEDNESDIVSTQSLVRPVTRSRRRVSRNPSIADSEYTVVSNSDDVQPTVQYDMDRSESTHVRSFSGWFNDNYKDDPSFQVILSSAADSRTSDNPLSSDVLEYIRSRKKEDAAYDPYDELSDPDSQSTLWITKYMENHSLNA